MTWGFRHRHFRDGRRACVVLANRRLRPEVRNCLRAMLPARCGHLELVRAPGATSPAQILQRASPAFPFKNKSVT